MAFELRGPIDDQIHNGLGVLLLIGPDEELVSVWGQREAGSIGSRWVDLKEELSPSGLQGVRSDGYLCRHQLAVLSRVYNLAAIGTPLGK